MKVASRRIHSGQNYSIRERCPRMETVLMETILLRAKASRTTACFDPTLISHISEDDETRPVQQ